MRKKPDKAMAGNATEKVEEFKKKRNKHSELVLDVRAI